MKTALFLVLALGFSPALARADIIYKCKSANYSDEKTSNLRFDDDGQGGFVEVEHWNGYPPGKFSVVGAALSGGKERQDLICFRG